MAEMHKAEGQSMRLALPPGRYVAIYRQTGQSHAARRCDLALAEEELGDSGRVLVRASGTEPLVRVYAEAPSAGVVDDLLAAGRAMVQG